MMMRFENEDDAEGGGGEEDRPFYISAQTVVSSPVSSLISQETAEKGGYSGVNDFPCLLLVYRLFLEQSRCMQISHLVNVVNGMRWLYVY